MKNALLFVIFAVAFGMAGCSKSKKDSAPCTGSDVSFTNNVPFTLCYGATAHGQDDIQTPEVKFFDVFGDSRCPSDVICVWQGRVDVGVTCTFGSTVLSDTLSLGGLGADPKSDSTQLLNTKIKLLSVDPYPINANGPTPLEEYKIKLVVTTL